MELRKALYIAECLEVLAQETELELNNLVARIALNDKKIFEVLADAVNIKADLYSRTVGERTNPPELKMLDRYNAEEED